MKYVTKTGNVIYTDSQSELDLLTFLEEYDLVREIGGQALMIKYCTCFRSNLKYYPDIIAQLKDGRIAIFEVKSDTAMSDHTNIEKYEALAAYCKQCGYMYMMVDPRNRYLTFEELERLPVIEGLAQLFGRWASTPDTERYPYKHFDKRAVAGWKEMYAKGMRDDEFNLQVHALIIRYGWFNTYTDGFMVYSKPVIVQSGRVVRWLE